MRASELAAALGGHAVGSDWIAHCPARPDATPSLSIAERGGRILVRCHAGCTRNAVIVGLKRRGLWNCGTWRGPQQSESAAVEAKPRRDPLRSWRDGYDIRNTLGELYLARRGLSLSDVGADALRFQPALWHWPTQDRWPAMIACVRRAGGVALTCHQTFIDRDGSKAPIERPRLFPGGTSPLGGGVWFGRLAPGAVAIVAEGIETTLSAMRLIGAPAGVAALSTRGIRQLILPKKAPRITIFADRDPGGQGLEAAWERCRYWKVEGRDVQVVVPDRDNEDANTTIKQSDGSFRTEDVRRDGSVSVWMTSARDDIEDELLTRLQTSDADESVAQTRRVISAAWRGKRSDVSAGEISKWTDLQRWLRVTGPPGGYEVRDSVLARAGRRGARSN